MLISRNGFRNVSERHVTGLSSSIVGWQRSESSIVGGQIEKSFGSINFLAHTPDTQ